MSFQMKFDTDNAAFTDSYEHEDNVLACATECARILRKIAEQLEQGNVGNFRTIFDANGNDVGRWKLEMTEDNGHKIVHYRGDDNLNRK